jgi:hypothetical protein
VPRIINADSAGRQRNQLMKGIALAVRELSRQTVFSDEARDLAAFITAALKAIHEGIDASVDAWEKRGYWVKADKFRMEWAWTGRMSSKMQEAVLSGDSASVATLSMQVAEKLSRVQISEHHRLGKPWVGAFNRLKGS